MMINTDLVYPVGSIYLSMKSTNPSIYFGGTWKQISQGRCLVGVDTTDNDFSSSELTGGEKTHILTGEELAKHNHTPTNGYVVGASISGGGSVIPVYNTHNYNSAYRTGDCGGSQPHNNLQPYLTCYIWQRTK